MSGSTTYFDLLPGDMIYYICLQYVYPTPISHLCKVSKYTERICDLPNLQLYEKLILQKLKRPLLNKSIISSKNLYIKYTDGASVYSCGHGYYGQLGHGNASEYKLPNIISYFIKTKIKIVKAFAEERHTLFLDNNNRAYSCGQGNYGQLGHNDDNDKLEPMLIKYFTDNNIKIVNMSGGEQHSLFLDNNGGVYGCGNGHYGQLGQGIHDIGDKLKPVLISYFTKKSIKIINIWAAEHHSLFLDNMGRLWTSGNGLYYRPDVRDQYSKKEPMLISYFIDHNIKISKASTNKSHTIILDDTGKLWSYGKGDFGQLGHGDNEDKLQFTHISYFTDHNIKIVNICTGLHHSLFLDNTGSIYSCGSAMYGQLGHGDTGNKLEPTLVKYFTNNIKIVSISAGRVHSLFLDNNGCIYSCGNGSYGQLGHGMTDTTDKLLPTRIQRLPFVIDIIAGAFSSIFLV